MNGSGRRNLQHLPERRDSSENERQDGNADRTNQSRPPTSNLLHNEQQTLGLQACELIVAIDFTKSNIWNGRLSFNGNSLHDVQSGCNPYMQALRFVEQGLQHLDDDRLIPAYGFGDSTTGGKAVFSFKFNNDPLKGLEAVSERYKQILPKVAMSGPTSFAPLIHQAMRTVYNSEMKFHLLVILADGHVSDECLEDTRKAIVDATAFPLSITVIGIGDGPWEMMEKFDKDLQEREWDNFHFFEFGKVFIDDLDDSCKSEAERFNSNVLAELRDHYEKAQYLVGRENMKDVQWMINTLPFGGLIDPPVDP